MPLKHYACLHIEIGAPDNVRRETVYFIPTADNMTEICLLESDIQEIRRSGCQYVHSGKWDHFSTLRQVPENMADEMIAKNTDSKRRYVKLNGKLNWSDRVFALLYPMAVFRAIYDIGDTGCMREYLGKESKVRDPEDEYVRFSFCGDETNALYIRYRYNEAKLRSFFEDMERYALEPMLDDIKFDIKFDIKANLDERVKNPKDADVYNNFKFYDCMLEFVDENRGHLMAQIMIECDFGDNFMELVEEPIGVPP